MTSAEPILDGVLAFDEPAVHLRRANSRRTPHELATLVESFASSTDWLGHVRLQSDRRWYERVALTEEHDIWVISWMPGQSTGFHDHGASAGAFLVTAGELVEYRPGQPSRTIAVGQSRAFETDYAHDVRNVSTAPAISIHAYSPPLTEMNEFSWDGDQLIPRPNDASHARDRFASGGQHREDRLARRTTIEQMLSTAREKLLRFSPEEAHTASSNGAVLVDIRPETQRAAEGSIPGALLVERNVLEWRFDPASDARHPLANDHDLHVIVFCSEGYTSSLAAAALQELGLWRATDIAGGFQEWRRRGLPVTVLQDSR
jgi:rhodanese-related sulfurtransferase/predicted metal-dependent enzyme (double-stranded beta helix superfamily)